MRSIALIIDDDRFMRRILSDLLIGGGFEVCEAADGETGWHTAVEKSPDLILIDLVMPHLDGIATCRKIRSFPQFRYTPIILLTSRTDLEHTVNPFSAGADDYLAKPFDPQDLLARAQGNLLKKRAIETLARQAEDSKELLEISRSVASSLDTVQILRQIVNRVAELVEDVLRCSIALIQRDERCGYIMASSDDPNLSGLRIFLDKYPEIQKVLQTGEPLLIEDVSRDPLMAQVLPDLEGQQFNTILAVPVIQQDQVLGVMVVRAARSRAGIAQQEIEFIQLVANLSASALQNAHYFEMLQEESGTLQAAKKRLEEELHIKAIYEQLFENASEGLAAFNDKGQVIYINRRALDIVGYEREELQGLSFVSLLEIPSIRPVFRLLRDRGRQNDRPALLDAAIRTRSGEERLLSVSFNQGPILDGLEVVAFRDVTERRRMERELSETKAILERANVRLQELDRHRAEFLNTAAHEMRVPVTIVSGYCALLQEMDSDNLTEQQKEFVASAVEGCDRLVDLINNMLDLSRLEAGKSQMNIESLDLCQAVAEAVQTMRPLAERHGLTLEADCTSSCVARFDTEYLYRVLFNLIGNAIKFTPSGGRIRVYLRPAENQIQVCVEDNGKGIAPERMPDLFKEFSQLRQEDSQRGSGLGLAICKKIVEAHGGRIWAESVPGRGSRFNFTLQRPG